MPPVAPMITAVMDFLRMDVSGGELGQLIEMKMAPAGAFKS